MHRQIIVDWLEKKDLHLLVFSVDAKGGLEPSYEFPSKLRSKGAYFLKPARDMAVTPDNVKVRRALELSAAR